MPRYFFDTADHNREIDDSGVELADDNAARCEAVRYAGEVLRDRPGSLGHGTAFVVDVRDEGGQVVFCVTIQATTPRTTNLDRQPR